MSSLTSRQRAHIRKLAHPLKPVVRIGAEGLTPAVLSSIEEAFNTREILKVKLLEAAPIDVRGAAQSVADGIAGAEVAQTVGRTIVLYRRHPERPEVRLPKAGV